MKWQHFFREHILDRGYNYYYKGAVESISFDNDILTAVVRGSEDYDVEISLLKNNIDDMHCSCPHADDGNNCKHMAAVLAAFENGAYKPNKESIKKSEIQREKSIESLVSDADENIIKSFLTQTLRDDERLLARFKRFAGVKISGIDMKIYKRQIDLIVKEHYGRKGYIDYRSADSFISELLVFLYDDVKMLIENREFLSAFDLTNYIFITVGKVDMDDSDGGTGMLAAQCSELWHTILKSADLNDRRVFFNWFMNHLDGAVVDYMEDYIEEIMMRAFDDDEFMSIKLDFVERKIALAEKNETSWHRNYQVGKWAMYYISLLEVSGKNWFEIEKYCKKHWEPSAIREYYIDECLKREEYDKAIDALHESISIDSGYRGLVTACRVKLKNTYLLCGKKELYMEQLWELVRNYNPGDFEFFRELKSQYSEEDWNVVREEIFLNIPRSVDVCRLFYEEGLYLRLFEHVLKMPGLYTMHVYLDALRDIYPKELLEKYRHEVESMAKKSADRAGYKELVSILRTMKTISGGKEVIENICENWRVVYKNRPAMMDELRRL